MQLATEHVAGVCGLGHSISRPRRGQLQFIALRQANPNNSNNSANPSPQPDVRCRALISATGLRSANSRWTHPKNAQCGN